MHTPKQMLFSPLWNHWSSDAIHFQTLGKSCHHHLHDLQIQFIGPWNSHRGSALHISDIRLSPRVVNSTALGSAITAIPCVLFGHWKHSSSTICSISMWMSILTKLLFTHTQSCMHATHRHIYMQCLFPLEKFLTWSIIWVSALLPNAK